MEVVSLWRLAWPWRAKMAAAAVLDSRTLAMEPACSRACIQLSGLLLVGSLAYVVLPELWWADGVAALALSGFIAKEGWRGWQAASRQGFAGGCGCG